THENGSRERAMKRIGENTRETALRWPATLQAESVTQRILGILKRELPRTWDACGPFEWVTFGYLGLSSTLIATFARNLAHPVRLVTTQALVAFLILALCRVAVRSDQRTVRDGEKFSTKFWRFWRHWYPHLFFLFCFEELGHLVHLVNPGW